MCDLYNLTANQQAIRDIAEVMHDGLGNLETVIEVCLFLSTIHSSKGQEWKAVFLLNAVDGCIPSNLGTGQTADIKEERRLLYVAMPRAKDQLSIGVPLRF